MVCEICVVKNKTFVNENIDDFNFLGFYIRDDKENIKSLLPNKIKWVDRKQIIKFIQERLRL